VVASPMKLSVAPEKALQASQLAAAALAPVAPPEPAGALWAGAALGALEEPVVAAPPLHADRANVRAIVDMTVAMGRDTLD